MTPSEDRRCQRRNLKAGWVSKSAILLVVTLLIEAGSVVSFAPYTDGAAAATSAKRKASSRVGFTNEDHARGNTDIKMVSSSIMKPIHTHLESPETTSGDQLPREVSSLPSSSRVVSLKGKRNRLSRMVRPKSLSSRARVEAPAISTRQRPDLLTKEEEKNLTLRIRSLRRAIRRRDEFVAQYHQQPNEEQWANACGLSVIDLRRVMYEGQEARSTLVSRNAGLVTSIAKKHFHNLKQATQSGGGLGTILTLQDMIQEGNLGIMQAAERYEPERGFRFSTYATYWIRQRILRAVSDSSRIIRLPAHGKFYE
jgi:hypothetical protein